MPIPAAPTKTTCTSCSWSTITRHRSDVIFLPSVCGHCGGKDLNHTPAGRIASLLNPVALMLGMFKK